MEKWFRLHWEVKKYRNPKKCQICGKELSTYLVDYDIPGWLRIAGETWRSLLLRSAALLDADSEKHSCLCGECSAIQHWGAEIVEEEIVH